MRVEAEHISSANAVELLERGRAAIGAGDLVIDLGAVKRCDSSAVALLLAWEREAKAVGKPLQLRAVPANITSLATLYGVEALVAVAG
jgi:phospholipid transport system transporter-binding protein